MANVTCAISGIVFNTSFLDGVSIPHTAGYYHPIFALSQKQLYQLYSKHTRLELKSVDSYLLFLAFLHSSGQITWKCPAAKDPNSASTRRMIENNISQLVSVLEKTSCIRWQGFTQPSFSVTYDNAQLDQIPNWIEAWKANLEQFGSKRADTRTLEALNKIENKLSYLILSGEDPRNFSAVIAEWADRVSEFPAEHREDWKRHIRSCFNTTKMFATPLADLKAIKEHCECNIEAGSIHFHTLCKVLREGIGRHVNYLGGSSLALGYTLLPLDSTKNDAELESLAAKAGDKPPVEGEYSSKLDYLRAKTRYQTALRLRAIPAELEVTSSTSNNITAITAITAKGKEL